MLSFNVYVGDALLHAIRKEVVGAVELLLNHKKPSGGMQVRRKVIGMEELFHEAGVCRSTDSELQTRLGEY